MREQAAVEFGDGYPAQVVFVPTSRDMIDLGEARGCDMSFEIPTLDLERSVNAHWILAMIYSIDFSIFERPFKSFGMATGEIDLDQIAEIGACVDINCGNTSNKFHDVLNEIRIMDILPSINGIDQKLLMLDDVIVQSHEEGVNLTQYLEDKIGLIVTVFYDNK